MKPIFLSLLCFCTLLVRAQNIILNPSFALHSLCPDDISEIYYATGWNTPTQGTPDYFNSCSLVPGLGVPQNFTGHQSSPSSSYAGLSAYASPSGTNSREYINTDIPALEIGKTYRVTILVSLADFSGYACDALAVFFYKDATPDEDLVFTPIPALPQIDYTSYGIISDSINWVTLSKTFIADSAYTHLVIGNFKTDAMLHVTTMVSGSLPSAYYYVDSVSVEKVHPAIVTNVMQNINVTLYPNPFTTRCTFSFDNVYQEPYQLTIFNIHGALVRQVNNITESELTITRDDLENGTYFYKLRGPDNIVLQGKMTIQ